MLVSAAWTGPAVLAAVNEVAQHRLYGTPGPDLRSILFAGGDWLLYALLTPLVFSIAARWPLARPHVARRALLHFCCSLAFCATWAGAGTLLAAALHDPNDSYSAPHFLSWLFITLPFGVAVYLAVVGIEHAIRFFAEGRHRETEVLRLSQQLAEARVAAIQAQVNPHFLFNTLNTIAVLVRDGDRAATRIVEQLADMLRRTLGPHRANEVTLGEEIALVRQYLAIEAARFSDRLRPEIDLDAALASAAVPSFAVQHLVENAIRHGIARRSDAGRVHVRAIRRGGELEISVFDDGAGLSIPGGEMPGHGLAATRERLRALYREAATLTVSRGAERGTVATLRIPYRLLGSELRVDER